MLDSLRVLLELYDYEVDTALGGQAAIDKLSSKQFDLILLDLKMPNVSGHDVMKFMSDHNLDTITIVVSGETSLDDISKALRHGAYDYLKKPYIPEELTSTVSNAVSKKLLENTNQAMQERLNRSEKLHRFIVNNSPDIIFILDHQGNFSFLNSKIESLLSYPKGQLLGNHFSTIINPNDEEKAQFFFEQASVPHAGIQSIELEIKPFSANQNSRHFEVSLWPIDEVNDNGALHTNKRYRVYGTARDISEKMEAEAFINFQAYHDLLTRLPNRSLFKDRLSVAITQSQRNNTQLAVMFIDLDRFKMINDSLGHTAGDRLLQVVSQRLQTCVRKGDTLSRFGGDEFTLLLPEVKNAQAATQIAEKILSEIKKPFQLGQHEVHIGASIGIATYPNCGENMDELIKNADIAMYRVKKTGKDGHQIFTNEMRSASTEQLMLEQDMRKAIDQNQFEICYQPQVDAKTQQLHGVEALIRWNHPKLGRLPPADFIPIAEESHLIVELDLHTLQKACREIRHYHHNGFPNLKLGMNLSPLMIERDSFVNDILGALNQHNFPPHLLELEITENVLMSDRPDIINKLRILNEQGINIAIDDFGTGYSSLSYLQHLPVNTLKIDRSFIREIKSTEDEACIVNAIISMAKGLKISIVAEGVENQEQFSYLKALDCAVIQGFLFGHATQFTEIAERYQETLARA
jgi:diguanylate cyclase (GGDEF)-like protein/PAS domain S-box-containing protein